MSQGFHPKPRMSFPSALAVGIEGLDEVMELELAELCTAEDLDRRLARHPLPGLTFSSIEPLAPGDKKARIRSTSYRIAVPPERLDEAKDRLSRLASGATWMVERPGKPAIDFRPDLEQVRIQDGVLLMRLKNREGGAGPRDVLAALGLSDLEEQGVYLTRTEVELQ
jgi:radical SAM-linked protein